jgi:hypothetical protein
VLRIPAEWAHKSIRCKHCGTIVRAEQKAGTGKSSVVVAKAPAEKVRRDEDDFAFPRTPRPRRRWNIPVSRLILAGVALAGLIGIGVTVYKLTPADPEATAARGPTTNGMSPAADETLPAATGPFPRRLLAIQVVNYFYFDPTGYGKKPYDGHTFVERFAKFLHVAPSQVVDLSDAAPGAQARPPLKPVIEHAVTDFLTKNRAQDRLALLFSGHAVEIEDQPYLVPLEGEATDKGTLIPLSWLYAQLKQCPGRQKLLILDLCRRDPSQGVIRQASGPMGDKTFAALQNPPEGVQVWTACAAGQCSCEDRALLEGSIFLTKILETLVPGKEASRFGIQQPQDLLPLEPLNGAVSVATEREVASLFKQKQTPLVLGGVSSSGGATYDPNEPPPPPVSVDWRPGKGFVPADKWLVQGILQEAAEIPPVKGRAAGAERFRAEFFPIFPQSVLKDYPPDNAPSEFRDTIRKAVAALKTHAKAFQEVFYGDLAQLKRDVVSKQRDQATAKRELDEALEMLMEAGKKRGQERSKRWQAYFGYVHARLLERIAYTFEYNYLLAAIRTDSLPERDPKQQHRGWRLASRDKMQAKGEDGRQAKAYAADSKKILAKMAEEHRGTPWEILAKRDAMTALGLEWRPTR